MDGDLREAERRHGATRRVDDHARLLAAQLRAGLLDEEQVALAARLGHPAATLVARGDHQPPPSHAWHGE